MSRYLVSFGAVALVLVALGVTLGSIYTARAAQPTSVRWLLAHEPVGLYDEAVGVFAETLTRESNGELVLEVVRPDTEKYPNGMSYADVLAELASGSVQLSSTFAVADGTTYNRFWALGLPFLFTDYDDALARITGASGEALLEGLSIEAPYKALAYTLSGGFRIIASDSFSVRTLSDLQGKRIATSGGPVAEATLAALGAEPVTIREGEKVKSVDGIETTYTRISETLDTAPSFAKHVSELNHSFFLTTIVVDDAFFASLSPRGQRALEQAARAAAKVEREDSIALAQATKESLIAQGSDISIPSAEVREALRELTSGVYARFEYLFGTDAAGLRAQ